MADLFSSLAFLFAILAAYLFPTLIAAARHHHQQLAIFTLNALLGWSVVGWVIALVWSMMTPRLAAAAPRA